MMYVVKSSGQIAIGTPAQPVTKDFVGSLLTDKDEPGWALVTCIGFMINDQVFQGFFLADNALPLNATMTNILRNVGDDSEVHGDAVILSGDDMLDRDEIPEFDERWGNA